jgi:hypothetical protein
VVSYGTHSNDFLLVEYGFILSRNRHDSITLDHIVLPLLSPFQKEILEQHAYLGSYYLTREGMCYRTQVAVRAMVTSGKRTKEFLDGGYDGMKEEGKMKRKTREVCRILRKEVEDAVEDLGRVKLEEDVKRVVSNRWKQIAGMLDEAEAVVMGDDAG